MRIQHNLSAINSQRNISATNQTMAKNLEKLSSGYRINRAGDDAAGLAISESMRSQITGMNQGKRNTQDGMFGRNGQQKYPEWFVEGTAQLAGGGFPTGWNNKL